MINVKSAFLCGFVLGTVFGTSGLAAFFGGMLTGGILLKWYEEGEGAFPTEETSEATITSKIQTILTVASAKLGSLRNPGPSKTFTK